MPPSRHSSSSRSSHSSSSRSSSFSRSSSRSSSSRSSRSSYSSGRSSSAGSSFSRGPSSHSTSSHSSIPTFRGSSPRTPAYRPSAPATPPRRPRVNQPIGFILSNALRPSYYYGKQHDYVYYPESWTDQASGNSYEKGYYDENGEYYASVAFPNNGKYENVVCQCPYCGRESILNLTAEDVSTHDLECPNCGGPMEIQSKLEEYIDKPVENTHTYASEESLRPFTEKTKKKKRRWPIVLIVLAILWGIGTFSENSSDYGSSGGQTVQQISTGGNNAMSFGSEIRLVSNGDNSYTYASGGSQSYDKRLRWDRDADSYYDADTECWLWYNKDVSPAIWQYWYEGISSDFGDYGWMEHDSTGWYIEQSEGNWISLPNRYASADLWYITD